ncbi:GNAT family N-acetyltransferase [Pelagimonas varians]|uniref:N-acetyltransferase domain-containing protein n=1 Tax=Pelagimonas varians TaxID=696760 RepID=A0A238K6N1_9RHOB|nr:GNAT family N-acetyltransferase [Pelagimonas varians]PYG31892.1 RimJ/RimL family protein N-acetyltransferase [Pelagimonas varians]SMX38465.1 hypothetical protein PEV8663_01327 [Pelagimonas varians]
MIETARLTLRAGRADDLTPLHEIFSDTRAMRYWDRPPHENLDQTARFLDNFMVPDPQTREEYILEYQGRCVGKAGMWRRFEIGYILHPDLWGLGLVTEGLQTIVPRVFERFPDAASLTAELDPRNIGSVKVLRKLGFTQTDLKEKNFLYGESEWCDTAYFRLLRP